MSRQVELSSDAAPSRSGAARHPQAGRAQAGGRARRSARLGADARRHVDSTLVKALARAFRWRRLLEDGIYATLEELAAAEKINPSYVSRVLRLTLLAPDIVEAILDGRQPVTLTLARLFKPFPIEWDEQARMLE